MRILLVEDDPVLGDVMVRSLKDTGHRVELARTRSEASHFWRVTQFDAVLLDLGLPDGSGLQALRDARRRGDRTSVLVLTADNRTEERIAGLDAGADDYLGKPFDLAEVEARLRAMLRRQHGVTDREQVGGLIFDRRQRRAFIKDMTLDLPPREFEMLRLLMTPPGRVLSKRVLSDQLSDFDDMLADNTLEVFASRLRKKLLGSGAVIRTLRGLGYVLEAEG